MVTNMGLFDKLKKKDNDTVSIEKLISEPYDQKYFDECKYIKWDDEDFTIPEELILTDDSYLHEAVEVFYKAGGREFFKVEDADKYAYNWIEFVGNLYQEIEDGKYKPDGKYHKNPLSDVEREQLKKQGVLDLFLDDIKGDDI